MNWEVREGLLQVEGTRKSEEPGQNPSRVFAAKLLFE